MLCHIALVLIAVVVVSVVGDGLGHADQITVKLGMPQLAKCFMLRPRDAPIALGFASILENCLRLSKGTALSCQIVVGERKQF
jgi:hypothetical protein